MDCDDRDPVAADPLDDRWLGRHALAQVVDGNGEHLRLLSSQTAEFRPAETCATTGEARLGV